MCTLAASMNLTAASRSAACMTPFEKVDHAQRSHFQSLSININVTFPGVSKFKKSEDFFCKPIQSVLYNTSNTQIGSILLSPQLKIQLKIFSNGSVESIQFQSFPFYVVYTENVNCCQFLSNWTTESSIFHIPLIFQQWRLLGERREWWIPPKLMLLSEENSARALNAILEDDPDKLIPLISKVCACGFLLNGCMEVMSSFSKMQTSASISLSSTQRNASKHSDLRHMPSFTSLTN